MLSKNDMLTAVVLEELLQRVSRQAREMEDLMATAVVMITTLTVVEVNIMSICSSFVGIRIFDADFDRATHFLTPSRVELMGKRSILCLETTTNR